MACFLCGVFLRRGLKAGLSRKGWRRGVVGRRRGIGLGVGRRRGVGLAVVGRRRSRVAEVAGGRNRSRMGCVAGIRT